jgi:hypothetical protein
MNEIELRKKIQHYKLLCIILTVVSIAFVALFVIVMFSFKNKEDDLTIFLSAFGLVGVPFLATLFFTAFDKIKFINLPNLIKDDIVNDFRGELGKHRDVVNEGFINEIKNLGSIYFTGIMKQLRGKNIFRDISEPADFAYEQHEHLTSKFLFIGIGENVLPTFVLNDMINNKNIPGINKKYEILYTLNYSISEIRYQSMLENGKVVNSARAYHDLNVNGINVLKNKLEINATMPAIFEFREHSIFPFGLIIAHGNYIWFSQLWNHQDSKEEGVVLEIRRDSNFGRELIKSFDEIWTSCGN